MPAGIISTNMPEVRPAGDPSCYAPTALKQPPTWNLHRMNLPIQVSGIIVYP